VRQRAMALISIAHPDHRAELLARAKQRHYVFAEELEPRSSYTTAHEKAIATVAGDLLLRPIRETDEDRVHDLFYNLSPDTVYKRWMSVSPPMHHRDLLRYLRVDDVDHVAIVAETRGTETEPELVGVARYHTDPATGRADVAIVVRDDWQNKGVGTAMLEHLADIADRNGIAGFTASVLATNSAMLHLFRKVWRSATASLDGTVCTIDMPLQRGGPTAARA
jgi:GNAT superfamily N-acetyltransferase